MYPGNLLLQYGTLVHTGTSVTAVQVSLFSLSYHIPFLGYQVASLQVVSLLVCFFLFIYYYCTKVN